MTRSISLVVALAATALLVPAAFAATRDASPVIKWNAPKFGAIIATKQHLALYTWKQESDKKVHCTGACAKTWPPLTVAHGTMVARHVAGVMGTFAEIMRADGRTQVTLDGKPLYTFHGDSPTKILCNGVDGWFVVHAH
jgi:predicted lipoprotein with Yx(FWY)xxD motif